MKNDCWKLEKGLMNYKQAILFLQEKSKKELLAGQEEEILNLLSSYTKTLTILERYDKGELKETKGGKTKFVLEYANCLKIITELRKELVAKKRSGGLFGNEREGSFEGIIKGRPFSDGNKRSAAFLFVYFLDKTNYLFKTIRRDKNKRQYSCRRKRAKRKRDNDKKLLKIC